MKEIAEQYEIDWTPDLSAIETNIIDNNTNRLGTIAKINMGEEQKEQVLSDIAAVHVSVTSNTNNCTFIRFYAYVLYFVCCFFLV
jgi:hypothetical protein